MNSKFDSYVGQLDGLLEKLKSSEAKSLTNIKSFPEIGACHALIENGRYLYVGISKNLKQRMQNHTSGRGEQSVFAFKLARDLANNTVAESRKALMKNDEFAAAMKETTFRVKQMGAKRVQIYDPILRSLRSLCDSLPRSPIQRL